MWKTTSSWGAHVEDAIKQMLPPCQIKCPINEDIQRTNVLISLLPEDIEAAKGGIIQIGDYLYEKNPFFNICGYICGLCELECNYKAKGGAIRRRLLKRFLSDHYTDYLKKKEKLEIARDRENIAIMGGGPGGLMCAYVRSISFVLEAHSLALGPTPRRVYADSIRTIIYTYYGRCLWLPLQLYYVRFDYPPAVHEVTCIINRKRSTRTRRARYGSEKSAGINGRAPALQAEIELLPIHRIGSP